MKTSKKKTLRGGARPNSGAKKIKDSREPLTLYVAKSIMKKAGGKDALRTALYVHIGQRLKVE